jgi:hypothetical protein
MDRAMASSNRQNAEVGAATQTQQWANAQAPGQGVQGAGPSTAGISPGKGQISAAADDGGPINDNQSPPMQCAQGFKQVGSSCQPTDQNAGGKNVTGYQSQVDMAQMMLMAASGLLLISFLLGMYAKHLIATAVGPQAPVILALAAKIYTWAKYMAYAACACAAIVTVMGISILAQGQTMQGGIFTGIGAMLTVMSYMAAEGYAKAAAATTEASTLATTAAAQDAAFQATMIAPHAAASSAASAAGTAGTAPATLTGLGSAAGGAGAIGANQVHPSGG